MQSRLIYSTWPQIGTNQRFRITTQKKTARIQTIDIFYPRQGEQIFSAPVSAFSLRKKLYIWRHQTKIRAAPVHHPFAMFSHGQRPRPAVCRSCRFSSAIRQWGLSGHCEIKFYRPDEGRKVTELETLM